MLAVSDNLAQCFSALRGHKLRASLTILGLTMGVATLITVMTIVQGANLYVEQKIANLGTNVFQIARTPFAVTDFEIIIKALKFKKLELEDMNAVAEGCSACQEVGASTSSSVRARSGDKELQDVNFYGQTANMADIDTRKIEVGRYFTSSEAEHRANVCLIGDTLMRELFLGEDPIGKPVRIGNDEFTVVGGMEKIGSVLGQDQDNFVIVPLPVFLRIQGIHSSITINVKTRPGKFENAQDQAHLILRSRRHLSGNMEDDFFIGTKDSYMALWRSISGAFFAVFIMVSAISVVIGGIVIMNVMLMSVTLRRREIGVRRAVGATKRDILGQFIVESVVQCIVGGMAGITLGFLVATSAADLHAISRVRADVGGGDGSVPKFRGRTIFRDLSGIARIATGPRGRVEVRVMGIMTACPGPGKFSCRDGNAALVEGAHCLDRARHRHRRLLGDLHGGNHSGLEQVRARQSGVARLAHLFSDAISAWNGPSHLPERIRTRKYIEYDYADFIRRAAPHVAIVTTSGTRGFFLGDSNLITSGNHSVEKVIVRGAEPEYTEAIPLFSIAQGRFISTFDQEHARPVVVLGAAINESLFPGTDAIGKMVRINGSHYEVIGVFEHDQGLFLGPGVDIFAIIPLSNFKKQYPEAKELIMIFTVPKDVNVEMAQGEVIQAMRRLRRIPVDKENDFELSSPDFLSNLWNQLTGALVILTTVISSIGLLVGGIGVMNIMLISVTERTQEIGVRKAIGARRADIRLQFLLEAVALTLVGGTLGILIGAAISTLVRTLVPSIPATFLIFGLRLAS